MPTMKPVPPRLYPLLAHVSSTNKPPMLSIRRLRGLRTNQGIISSFAAVCGLGALFIYVETSRLLIPASYVTKEDLDSLTSGFSSDLVQQESHHTFHAPLSPHPHRPSVFIIGFSQCGGHVITTALSAHPDIMVNMNDVKYFTSQVNKTREWYINKMPPSLDHHVTIDVSYNYISSRSTLERIKSFNKTAKIIVFLCDPVSRLITRYRERLLKLNSVSSQENTNATLKTASTLPLRAFDTKHFKSWTSSYKNGTRKLNNYVLSLVGDYYPPLLDVHKVFPAKQVLFVDKGRFYKNPKNELSVLHSFLKVHQDSGSIHLNSSGDEFCFRITHGQEKCVKDVAKSALQMLRKKEPAFMRHLITFYSKINDKLFEYLDLDNKYFDWLYLSKNTNSNR